MVLRQWAWFPAARVHCGREEWWVHFIWSDVELWTKLERILQLDADMNGVPCMGQIRRHMSSCREGIEGPPASHRRCGPGLRAGTGKYNSYSSGSEEYEQEEENGAVLVHGAKQS
ncbi:hypothetical protein EI94DRAFT_1702082 [Lactarius quietus]|nr:hypothetical protein EI94DRAFT_1702082 [Lactarius quietus]